MIIGKFVAVAIIGYLLGSIPFGLIVSRFRAKTDIREHGSGKTGATNVLRTAGIRAAIFSAVLDVIKGGLAVFFAGLIISDSQLAVGTVSLGVPAAQGMAALAAVIGHIWPVFAKFRGGRGVATFFGGMLTIHPAAGLSAGAILLITFTLTRYASLGSIVGMISACVILAPLTIFYGLPIAYLAYALAGTILIIIMHRDNISRLLAGKERRITIKKSEKKDVPTSAESTR